MNEVEIKEQVNKYFWVDPRKVYFDNKKNQRDIGFESLDDINELADSIQVNGMQSAIVAVRIDPKENNGYEYELIHGFRRMNAVNLVIKRSPETVRRIPVQIVDKNKISEVDIILKHVLLNSGKPFTDLEMANIIITLENHGWTRDEISKKISKSTARISQILSFKALINSDKDVKDLVDSKLISNTEISQQLAQSKDKTETKEVMKLAIEEAKKTGKSKVTKKDIEKVSEKLGLNENKPSVKKELSKAEQINQKLKQMSQQDDANNSPVNDNNYDYEIKKMLSQISMISDNFIANVQSLVTDKVKLSELDELTTKLIKFIKENVE